MLVLKLRIHQYIGTFILPNVSTQLLLNLDKKKIGSY